MATAESILRDLRALQLDASPALRERVRALGEPTARRSLPSLPWRRSLLVLAPACVLAVVVAAAVHGIASSGRTEEHFASVGANARDGSTPAYAPDALDTGSGGSSF